MYVPPAFKETELTLIHETMRSARLGNFVTCTANGLICTPMPMFLNESEGEQGVIYGHVAKANPQWRETPTCDALAIFAGPDAYVTPSWYASKKEHGKGVPTWNYTAVHAYGVGGALLVGLVGFRFLPAAVAGLSTAQFAETHRRARVRTASAATSVPITAGVTTGVLTLSP